MDERTDEELLAAHEQGDDEAFSLIVDRYLQTIYSFVFRLIGDTHAAEDVTQDVFLKIWKSIDTFDAHSSRFKTWALRIARNSAIDYLRKKKMLAFSEFDTAEGTNTLTDTMADTELLPDELFARKEDEASLRDAVGHLPAQQREVLALHYTSHLTFEEIAALLGEPGNTVKSRHRRALIALRKLLGVGAPKNTA